MRGIEREQKSIFWTVNPELEIPADHPLRKICEILDGILREMSSTFDSLYNENGRPSILPGHLLRSLLLQTLYSIRSERMLVE